MKYSEYCQPCGECDWCRKNFRAIAFSRSAKRLLRDVQHVLSVEMLAHNANDRRHPQIKRKLRLLARINKLLAVKSKG